MAIKVDDLDEALAFYTDILGFTVRTDRPDFGVQGAWLDVGSQQVHLVVGEVPPAVGQHVAFLVEDLDTAVAELRDRGVEVSDPFELPMNRQSVVTDPFGNGIELHQRR